MKMLKKILLKLSSILRKWAKSLSPEDKAWDALLADWKTKNSKYDFRHRYDLGPSSTVMDLGGYTGQWASNIYGRYACNILIFEPVISFAEGISERFQYHDKIKVYPFGLGADDFKTTFKISADSTSQFIENGEEVPVQIKDIYQFFEVNNISRINLLKINIEGGEYDLLDYMIKKDMIKLFDDIQIQFHHFYPNAKERMKFIKDELSKTHELTYEYEWFWENWRRKQ